MSEKVLEEIGQRSSCRIMSDGQRSPSEAETMALPGGQQAKLSSLSLANLNSRNKGLGRVDSKFG